MATRFGGRSSAEHYALKVRWVVGCLSSVIVILISALMLVAWNHTAEIKQSKDLNEIKIENKDKIDILLAAYRIEEGIALNKSNFVITSMDADQTPTTAIRAKDLDIVVSKFSTRMIQANTPLTLDDLSDNPPLSAINIPQGYRAISIEVDKRSAVSGFVTPNSRVDVLLTYKEEGETKINTLAKFIRVVSVNNQTRTAVHNEISSHGTTVTLLTTEKDAKIIELARSMGTLSLTLLGSDATPGSSDTPEVISQREIFGAKPVEKTEVYHPGVMYVTDSKSGRQLRYVLTNNRWSLDRNINN